METHPDFKDLLALLNEHKVEHIILGVPPVRIDLITSITGVAGHQASAGKISGNYGDIPVSFLGRVQYIANKKATGRAKDLADMEALEDQ